MALPADFTTNPSSEPPAIFSVEINASLTTTWKEYDLRTSAFALRDDVNELVTRNGLTSADVVASAVLKRVAVQNRDADDGVEVSRRATVGTTSAPSPADAYNVAMVNGGGVEWDFHTRAEVTKFQIRTSTNTGNANVRIFFAVPRPLRTST